MPRRLDPVVALIVGAAVLCGTLVGERSQVVDVDELVFRSILTHMQAGDGYYEAIERALIEKEGAGPSQVRAVRTPVVSELLAPFPSGAWRWIAAIPAMLLGLLAAALAGPGLLAQRIAAALAGAWMVASLPLLYLHAELWGAPLLLGGALLLRSDRDAPAAALSALATLTRELFGLSLVAGVLLRRARRPWLIAAAATALGGALHARWASQILDPLGKEAPFHALERYTYYLGPGQTVVAEVAGAALLVAAVAGFVLRRQDPAFRHLTVVVGPLVVATAAAGRSYWSLAWCGATSAAGAVAIVSLLERLGWARAQGPVPPTA